MNASAASAEDRLPAGLKLTWATGAAGVAILLNGISGLTLFYFTTVLKLDPKVAGLLIFICRLYDALSDPISGYLSDRTQSKWGRRRPYLFAGAIISAGSFFMVFTVPFFGPYDSVTSGAGLIAVSYVLLALLLYTTGYSLFNVPYMAMPAEMTRGYHERSSVHGYRVVFAAVGSFAVQSMMGFLLDAYGKGVEGHRMVAITGASLIFVTMMVTFFGTARAPYVPHTPVRVPWREQLLGFARNKPFLQILGVKLAQLFGLSASTGGLVFFLATVVNQPLKNLALIGAANTIAVLVSTPVLIRLSRIIGKRGAYALCAVITGLTALSWSLAEPDDGAWTLAVRGFLLGIAFAGNVLFAMSMLTDAMEIDSHATGMRREGMYSALYSFVEKFAFALGPLIMGFALSYAGFDPRNPPAVADAGVRQAVLLGIAYIPAAMAFVAVAILAFYRLDERALLEARAGARPAG
jgi:glycoside/pentoside/hexuronide:cation symporter, GPH family